MRVVILQSNYLPWKGYFDLIHDADVFVFRDDVKYTKQDWRNRNRLYPKEGLRWLTVPVAHAAVRQKIRDVCLPDLTWQSRHFALITRAYKSAPFFAQLEPLLHEVYIEKAWKYLFQLNRHFIQRISAMLGIDTLFYDSIDYELCGGRVICLINLLKQVKATEYLTGPVARNYLGSHEHLFAENGIRLVYKDYSGYPPYPQIRSPFEHGVSIIDMLANIAIADIPYYIWGWRTRQEQLKVGGTRPGSGEETTTPAAGDISVAAV